MSCNYGYKTLPHRYATRVDNFNLETLLFSDLFAHKSRIAHGAVFAGNMYRDDLVGFLGDLLVDFGEIPWRWCRGRWMNRAGYQFVIELIAVNVDSIAINFVTKAEICWYYCNAQVFSFLLCDIRATIS